MIWYEGCWVFLLCQHQYVIIMFVWGVLGTQHNLGILFTNYAIGNIVLVFLSHILTTMLLFVTIHHNKVDKLVICWTTYSQKQG